MWWCNVGADGDTSGGRIADDDYVRRKEGGGGGFWTFFHSKEGGAGVTGWEQRLCSRLLLLSLGLPLMNVSVCNQLTQGQLEKQPHIS